MNGCCADKACDPETCVELPRGATCGECRHFTRCSWLIGAEADWTVCDWFPRRFARAPDAAKEGT